MPPEDTARETAFLSASVGERAAPWHAALVRLGLAAAALVAVSAPEWGEMLHQWWNIDTYNHILIVPVILAWLVWLKRDEAARLDPRAWWPGLGLVAAAMALWAAGRLTGINLLAHAGAVAMVQAAVVALLGPRVSILLALPLGFAAFLVPFGDGLIPALQFVTAEIAVALTRTGGIAAEIDGIHIHTPAGLFIVAEACSGVKFLAAMVALGVLVCFTRFASWTRRAAFMLAAIVVPVLANGVRAWGTIAVAHAYGIEFAIGFDHFVYGWVFFALVVAVLLGAAWPFFEREPEDYGPGAAVIASSAMIGRAARGDASGGAMLAALLALSLAAAIVAPPTMG